MNGNMNERDFREAYSALEEKVAADARLKEETKALVARMENQRLAPARKPAKAPKRPRSKRFLPVAACLALAVCLLAAGGFLMNRSETGNQPSGNQSGEEQGDIMSNNFFTLVAYADETAERTGGGTALSLDVCCPGALGAGHRYDPATGTTDRSTVDVSITYYFDLAVKGENIDTLEYSISGPDAAFVGNAAWRYSEGDERPQETPAYDVHTSFTVPFEGDESMFSETSFRVIQFDFTLEEPFTSEYNALYEDRDNLDSFMASTLLLYKQGSERLCQTAVSVTATFKDGTKQTKTYGFEPAADHDEILEKMAYGGWDYESETCLFVLVEK